MAHKSSFVLLFIACWVSDRGQGRLSGEERYGSDPSLLTRDLLQTLIHKHLLKHTHSGRHIVFPLPCRTINIYILCMSASVATATGADSLENSWIFLFFYCLHAAVGPGNLWWASRNSSTVDASCKAPDLLLPQDYCKSSKNSE